MFQLSRVKSIKLSLKLVDIYKELHLKVLTLYRYLHKWLSVNKRGFNLNPNCVTRLVKLVIVLELWVFAKNLSLTQKFGDDFL